VLVASSSSAEGEHRAITLSYQATNPVGRRLAVVSAVTRPGTLVLAPTIDALGLTVYTAGSRGPLPQRVGHLPVSGGELTDLSEVF
jgi:hypothetical protein